MATLNVPFILNEVEDEVALIIMCHGGPGGSKDGPDDLFVALSQQLAKQRISSVRFDFRGSGESSEPFSSCSLTTMVEDLNFISSQFLERSNVLLLGESLGATVCLASGLFRGGVLLWPAVDLSDTEFGELITADHLQQAETGTIVDLGWEKFSSAFFMQILSTKLYPRALQVDGPTLILHGSNDKSVPVVQSHLLNRLIGHSLLHIHPNGQHGLKTQPERDSAISQITEWLEANAVKIPTLTARSAA